MLFEYLKIGFCLCSVFIKYQSGALYVPDCVLESAESRSISEVWIASLAFRRPAWHGGRELRFEAKLPAWLVPSSITL